MNKSRLKKIAFMPEPIFESTLDQISDKGRAILKSIEDYKFYIDQTLRVVKNDQNLSGLIMQKKKNLDHAAQDIYNIVFEIENIDISVAHDNQNAEIDDDGPKSPEENKDSNLPQDNKVPQDNNKIPQDNSKMPEDNKDSKLPPKDELNKGGL